MPAALLNAASPESATNVFVGGSNGDGADLRVDVFRSDTFLPSTIGVSRSVDHGRVLALLLDAIGIQASFHQAIDGASRFTLAVGPLFADTGF